MPLDIPNLDDRTFRDLVDEALTIVPRYAPGWTNHNPSDPGITLVELFAYLAELLIYRLNRVTKETKIRFLQLLTGNNFEFDEEPSVEKVDDALREAVLRLRQPGRAVTAEDYESLALQSTIGAPQRQKLVRAVAFAGRKLQHSADVASKVNAPGHVSIVVVPEADVNDDAADELAMNVTRFFGDKRLLTTQVHVAKPFYVWVTLGAVIEPCFDAADSDPGVIEKAFRSLQNYFSPWPGSGPQMKGWPFGRALYLSEVYDVLEKVDAIDHVRDVYVARISATTYSSEESTRIGVQVGRSTIASGSRLGAEMKTGSERLLRDGAGRLSAVLLRPYELIRIAPDVSNFTIKRPDMGRTFN